MIFLYHYSYKYVIHTYIKAKGSLFLQVLLIAIRLAIPSVLRFSICVFILFSAFLLCGWLVLGPYHPKVSIINVCITVKIIHTIWYVVWGFFIVNGESILYSYWRWFIHNLWNGTHKQPIICCEIFQRVLSDFIHIRFYLCCAKFVHWNLQSCIWVSISK